MQTQIAKVTWRSPALTRLRALPIQSQMIAFVVAALLPFAMLTVWYLWTEQRDARQEANQRVERIAKAVAKDVSAFVQETQTQLALVAGDIAKGDDASAVNFNVSQYLRMHPHVLDMAWWNSRGQAVLSYHGMTLSEALVKRALNSDGLTYLGLLPNPKTGRSDAMLSYTVLDARGLRRGFLIVTLDLLSLNGRLLKSVPADAVVPVIDQDETILFRSAQSEEWIGKPTPPAQAQVVRALTEGFVQSRGVDGVMRFYAVADVPGLNWRVFAGVRESEVMAEVQNKFNLTLIVFALTLALVLWLGQYLSRALAQPVQGLADVARRVAHGEEARAHVSGPVEVREVATQFNKMLDSIQQAREEKVAINSHYDSLLKNARDMVLLVNADGRIVQANAAAIEAYGFTEPELLTKTVVDLRAPQARAMADADWRASASASGALFETVHQRKDGSLIYVEVSSSAIDIEGKLYRQSFIRDVSDRKRSDNTLRRRTRAITALSKCNYALVHAVTVEQLTENVCQIIVDAGGYLMAWVGFALTDAEHTVQAVAQAGDDSGYIKTLSLTWAENPHGMGPTGVAIRTGQTVVARHLQTAENFEPWRMPALERGFQASVALPLIAKVGTLGALNVYAQEPDAFDQDEVKLLEELAGNLTYGVASLQSQVVRIQLEDTLVASEQRFRSLIENSPAGVFVVRDNHFVYANPHMERILGFARGEMIGVALHQVVAPKDQAILLDAHQQVVQRGFAGNFSVQALRLDGIAIDLGLQYVEAEFEGVPSMIGMAQDVSERYRAQAEIRHYIERLEQTTEATLQSVALMVEQRDPYTAGHERRVGELAAEIGREMGLSEDTNKGLRLTGFVHDIGKIAVPAELLAKPTRLSEPEMALIRVHAQVGHDVLKNVEFPWPVCEVILQHHERLDGTGYPRGLKGNQILLEARIMMVADVVESMGSHRPYRPSLGIEAALAEVESYSGSRYDPQVVEACLRLFREHGYTLPS